MRDKLVIPLALCASLSCALLAHWIVRCVHYLRRRLRGVWPGRDEREALQGARPAQNEEDLGQA